MQQDSFIWLDGKLQAAKDAQVNVLSHSLHYGLGFFEGIRSYHSDDQSYVFRLQDHIQRLLNSAKITDTQVPYNANELTRACLEVLKANRLAAGSIRPLVYIGAGVLGINPAANPVHVAIAAWEWGAYLGAEALANGTHTKISTYSRYHPNTTLMHAKMTGPYNLSILAKKEALKQGYQEAILLDSDGYVAEGAGENIFVVHNNRLYTPLRMNILPGITRDTIMLFAKEMGLEVIEQRFARDFLYLADEAFFTGTAVEVTPIASVDGIAIGSGKRGPITAQLQEAYFKCVTGKLSQYQHFLSPYTLDESLGTCTK